MAATPSTMALFSKNVAPPLAVICKIILGAFPETEWIAVLMSDGVPESGQE